MRNRRKFEYVSLSEPKIIENLYIRIDLDVIQRDLTNIVHIFHVPVNPVHFVVIKLQALKLPFISLYCNN